MNGAVGNDSGERIGIDIDTDPARLDRALIHAFLAGSYWARDIPRSVVDRALDHSLGFGAYRGSAQVGFARVITDRATFAYLADVFVIETERGHGIARRLLDAVHSHPDLQGLRRWMLVTRDAQALYAACGYRVVLAPERFMERHDPDVYRRT
jgi:GNAT superfamily N-acetyltransferase